MKRGKIIMLALVISAYTGGMIIAAPNTTSGRTAPATTKQAPAKKQKITKEDQKRIDAWKQGFKDSKVGKKNTKKMTGNILTAYNSGFEYREKNPKIAKVPTDSEILNIIYEYEQTQMRPIQREGSSEQLEYLLEDEGARLSVMDEEGIGYLLDDEGSHPRLQEDDTELMKPRPIQREGPRQQEEEILGDDLPQFAEEEILGDDLPQFNRN